MVGDRQSPARYECISEKSLSTSATMPTPDSTCGHTCHIDRCDRMQSTHRLKKAQDKRMKGALMSQVTCMLQA